MNGTEDSIVKWFSKNKRALPWRIDRDPYHVWISEIMLQQTRIEAVIPYYERFIKRLPTIKDLATIKEDELFKLWEGLGYYNRVRNLKKAAIQIIEKYKGVFPSTIEEMKALPGIGEYTASAISSISFGKKEVAIDGNVLRVYARFHNLYQNIDLARTKKEIRTQLMKVIPEDAGDFNEGLMEIGEVVCVPNAIPKCSLCPLREKCKANQEQTWQELPIKSSNLKQKEMDYTVFLFRWENEFAIHLRTQQGLLNQLWEFPNLEGARTKKEVKDYLIKQEIKAVSIKRFISYKHVFSHVIWKMSSYYILLEEKSPLYEWASIQELEEKYAIPTAFKPFLDEIKTSIKKKGL